MYDEFARMFLQVGRVDAFEVLDKRKPTSPPLSLLCSSLAHSSSVFCLAGFQEERARCPDFYDVRSSSFFFARASSSHLPLLSFFLAQLFKAKYRDQIASIRANAPTKSASDSLAKKLKPKRPLDHSKSPSAPLSTSLDSDSDSDSKPRPLVVARADISAFVASSSSSSSPSSSPSSSSSSSPSLLRVSELYEKANKKPVPASS
jgi:hypothetical protein